MASSTHFGDRCVEQTNDAVGEGGRRWKDTLLVRYVRSIPGRKYLCLEEGTSSAWLYEVLSPHVEEIVVVGLTERRRGQKNDALDAFQRAEELRTGTIKTSVFKAPRRFSRLRELSGVP